MKYIPRTVVICIAVFVLSGCRLASQTPPSTNSDQISQLSEDDQFFSTLPEEYQRLTIPYLRKQSFPGRDITLIENLSDGSNYSQSVVSFKSEGFTINGLLTKPTTKMPEGGYPAVVFVHGYIPPDQYKTTQKYVEYVDYFARNGVVVFKIDLRGHGESEGDASGAYFSSNYIYDVLNARASLEKLEYVNPDKIGLWGHSMAGNVVLRSMAVRPEIPVGVIWAGAVYTYQDMREYGIQDTSYQPSQNPSRGRRTQLYETVGEPDEPDNQFWQRVAPTTYLSDIKGRVEIHHARNDAVVTIEYSRNLEQLLELAAVDHTLYEYPSGGHNISSPAFSEAMRLSVEALKE